MKRQVGIGSIWCELHPVQELAWISKSGVTELQRLLNQGSFEMVGRIDDMKDRYGRDLRLIRRKLPDGSYESIAAEMRESGLAHRYLGGFKSGWC